MSFRPKVLAMIDEPDGKPRFSADRRIKITRIKTAWDGHRAVFQ